MPLQKMYKCGCQSELYKRSSVFQCPYCKGTGEWEGSVYLPHYSGNFKPIDYITIKTNNEDYCEYVNCACGEEMFLSDSEPKVCSCGRIFKLSIETFVDESHIGDFEFLLKESERKNDRTN